MSQSSNTPQQPRPRHFLRRHNGDLVPLIALDELPSFIRLVDVKCPMDFADTKGMASLGLEPGSGGQYTVEVDTTDIDLGHGHSGAASTIHADDASRRCNNVNPSEAGYEGSRMSVAAETTDGESHPSAHRPSVVKRYEPVTPGAFGQKIFCSHWIRTGECDFMQQGCRFRHDMPDLQTLQTLGFQGWPRWFRETQGVPPPSRREIGIVPGPYGRQASFSPGPAAWGRSPTSAPVSAPFPQSQYRPNLRDSNQYGPSTPGHNSPNPYLSANQPGGNANPHVSSWLASSNTGPAPAMQQPSVMSPITQGFSGFPGPLSNPSKVGAAYPATSAQMQQTIPTEPRHQARMASGHAAQTSAFLPPSQLFAASSAQTGHVGNITSLDLPTNPSFDVAGAGLPNRPPKSLHGLSEVRSSRRFIAPDSRVASAAATGLERKRSWSGQQQSPRFHPSTIMARGKTATEQFKRNGTATAPNRFQPTGDDLREEGEVMDTEGNA